MEGDNNNLLEQTKEEEKKKEEEEKKKKEEEEKKKQTKIPRKNLLLLDSKERKSLRNAFRKVTDPKSPLYIEYLDIVSKHGGIPDISPIKKQDFGHCTHQEPLFLPWHRVYIEKFEQLLQKVDSTISLPYWDWFAKDSLGNYKGVPKFFSTEFRKVKNKDVPNPLFSGPTWRARPWVIQENHHHRNTIRGYDTSLINTYFKAQEEQLKIAITHTKFFHQSEPSFSRHLEATNHDFFHGWIAGVTLLHGTPMPAGDMGYLENSSFDPIFWFHHANVDRIFASWEGNNSIDTAILDEVVVPWKIKVKDVTPPLYQ